jgi:hypothetical protein
MNDSTQITVGESRVNYTVLANILLRDDSITLEARGLMANLLSNAPGWTISVKAMTKYLFNPKILGVMKSGHGKTQIYRIMDELMLAGYLKRDTIYKDGRVEKVTYTLYAEPLPLEDRSKKVGECNRKPVSRKPESSNTENSKPEQLKNYQPKELTNKRNNKGKEDTPPPAPKLAPHQANTLAREKRYAPNTPNAVKDMMQALEDVTQSINTSKLEETAYELIGRDVTPAEVLTLYGGSNCYWRRVDWRGQKGNRPELGNITGTIIAAREWLQTEGGLTGDAEAALNYLITYQETKQATGWVNGAGNLARAAGQRLGGVQAVLVASKAELVQAVKAVAQ